MRANTQSLKVQKQTNLIQLFYVFKNKIINHVLPFITSQISPLVKGYFLYLKQKHDQKVTFPQVLLYSRLFQDFFPLLILQASLPLRNSVTFLENYCIIEISCDAQK